MILQEKLVGEIVVISGTKVLNVTNIEILNCTNSYQKHNENMNFEKKSNIIIIDGSHN